MLHILTAKKQSINDYSLVYDCYIDFFLIMSGFYRLEQALYLAL